MDSKNARFAVRLTVRKATPPEVAAVTDPPAESIVTREIIGLVFDQADRVSSGVYHAAFSLDDGYAVNGPDPRSCAVIKVALATTMRREFEALENRPSG